MSTILTVSQINTYVKSVIDSDINLKNIYVSGEISNFTDHYRTGHFYFTLKDGSSAIKAVMFRSAAERVRFEVQNGMKVVIRGNISVFERDGAYQLYCEDMIPDGQGALELAFEQLKKKLEQRGLFSQEHKKPLPPFPERIGVITSPTGAAVHDILTVLERRFPLAKVVFEPVLVQGSLAAPQIAAALKKFNRLHAADVLIVGRGGGSVEDLWAFNEEEVAYAIFDSEIPVISAVGHETDFTIADFVSDRRAPTPSAAAEIAVPDYRELLYSLDKTLDAMSNAVFLKLGSLKEEVGKFEKLLFALSPENKLVQYSQIVSMLQKSLTSSIGTAFVRYLSSLQSYSSRLESVSPLKTIGRGFSVVVNDRGETVKRAASLKDGDKITLRLSDGRADCIVTSVNLDEAQNGKENENYGNI